VVVGGGTKDWDALLSGLHAGGVVRHQEGRVDLDGMSGIRRFGLVGGFLATADRCGRAGRAIAGGGGLMEAVCCGRRERTANAENGKTGEGSSKNPGNEGLRTKLYQKASQSWNKVGG